MKHQFSLKDLPHSRKELIITEIDQETLKKAEKKVLQDLSKTMKLKGFRPGNIPESVVREQVEDQYVQLQSLQQALPEVANSILQEQDMRVIGEPSISFESVDPLKIVVAFDVFPSVEVGDYKKISVKVEKKEATDKEVQEAIKNIQERMTDYKEVDRAAKKDDRVEIDFDGKTPDGVPLENTSSKHHPVVIGSNMLIPGFEEELIGLKAGDEKEFPIEFPNDYHAKQLAGKKAIFAIKVHKVEESQVPELNEELIEKMTGEKQKVEEWKADLKKRIQEELDEQSKRALEDQYYEKLIGLTKIELPATMIEQEKQAVLQEIKQQILSRGLSYEDYLKSTGKNEEQLLESFEKQATDRLTLRLALQEISQKEGVSVSDVDVEERLNELLKHYPGEHHEKIKQQYQPGSQAYAALEYQLQMQKTLDKILPKI